MRLAKLILLVLITVLFSQEQTQIGNLIMENVPEIPDEVKQRTQQYRNVRSASFRSWDPRGSGMLIGTRFAETTQLHYVEQPLGVRQQITFFNEPVGGGSFCPDSDKHGFLFSKDIGGNEYYQIFYFNLKDGSHQMLTDGESRNGLGPWSEKGDRYAFTSNMGNGIDMQIYIGDLKGSEPIQVVTEPGYWVATSWSPDDTKLLVVRYVSITESYVHIIDLTTGEMTEVNHSDKKIGYGGAAFSKDGQGIYLTSDEDTEFKHLRYYDPATGKSKLITGHIPWNVTGFTQSDDGKYLAYLTNEDAISKLHLIRTKDNKEIPLPALPIGDIGGLSFRSDNRHRSLSFDNPQTSGDIYADIMRTIVNGGIDKRRSEVENSDPMIDVTFRGEGGLLVIHENSIEYVNLTKFSQHKIPVLETNEDLFIATGPIEFNKLQKLKFGDTKMCQITIKEMPHGTHYGYYFYDVDGKLNRVVEALDKVNKFNNEKYQ